MAARIHPLTGEPLGGKTARVQPRSELAELGLWQGLPGGIRSTAERSRPTHTSAQSYDAARNGTDLDGHWAFADALNADGANNQGVRQKLVNRSRYETGSNAYYAGILRTHCNMLVGVGPTLRMLTGNRPFNQLVEREFYAWMQRVQLRRKLWAMAHARTQDGEAFAVLQTNPIYQDGVQLDVTLIETEQCQSNFADGSDSLYMDGVKYDEWNNVLWYDVLPTHPGAGRAFGNYLPIQIAARDMLHWYRLERPGSHRGVPDLTSSLAVGAYSRRSREATVKAQETAASIGALMTTGLNAASDTEADPIAPFSTVEWVHRMLMAAPMGWDVKQMKGEHPNAQYADFHRLQISEQARPLNMPYNAAAGDSSTYSFASGKLDTLCYRAAIDVERQDCNDLVLDPLFAQWFREWTIVTARRDIPPAHQWDWPLHPVIDAVQEATATNTKLQNGTVSLRQVYSDQGQDLEDQLAIMAEDTFGEANDETIAKMRQICVLKNTPAHAIQHVAQILGVQVETASQGQPEMPSGQTDNEEEDANELAEAA